MPKVNLKKNSKNYIALEKAIQKEFLSSSLSVTSGGLAIALAKASVGGMLGCKIELESLPGKVNTLDAKLFSESQGRILVSLSPKNIPSFKKIMKGVSYAKIGKVGKNGKVIIADKNRKIIDTNVQKLLTAYHSFSNKMK